MHRRTYMASKAGRFISGLQQAGSMGPLFLLDEIEKVAKYKGDPTTALLEVLDPEQNHSFVDRYIEYSVDLSKAMFICTANDKKSIPSALSDRMEFIHFRAYNSDERWVILNEFLIPKMIKNYCIEDMSIEIEDSVLQRLAQEKQIRQIEKTLGKLLRKAAVQIYVHNKQEQLIDTAFAEIVFKGQNITRKNIGF